MHLRFCTMDPPRQPGSGWLQNAGGNKNQPTLAPTPDPSQITRAAPLPADLISRNGGEPVIVSVRAWMWFHAQCRVLLCDDAANHKVRRCDVMTNSQDACLCVVGTNTYHSQVVSEKRKEIFSQKNPVTWNRALRWHRQPMCYGPIQTPRTRIFGPLLLVY